MQQRRSRHLSRRIRSSIGFSRERIVHIQAKRNHGEHAQGNKALFLLFVVVVLATHTPVYLLCFCRQYRIKLNPDHICLSDARDVAVRAFSSGLYAGHWLIGRGLMAKAKETPIMRITKPLAVFHHDVEAV